MMVKALHAAAASQIIRWLLIGARSEQARLRNEENAVHGRLHALDAEKETGNGALRQRILEEPIHTDPHRDS